LQVICQRAKGNVWHCEIIFSVHRQVTEKTFDRHTIACLCACVTARWWLARFT